MRVRRPLPPPPATGRLLGLVRRRPVAGSSGAALFSVTDVHVAFTVLSEGLEDAAAVPGAAGGSGIAGLGSPPLGGGSFGGVGAGGLDGGGALGVGRGVGWGRVPFAQLETERLSPGAFKLEADRAKSGGLVSGTRAVTWNMQVGGFGGVRPAAREG